MRRLLFSALLILLPGAALAHTGAGDVSGFVHGVVHPLLGLDHVLAMLGVGVLAFVVGGRALMLVPLAFVAMLVGGFMLGAAGLPVVEPAIALSSVVIGGAAALNRPMPLKGAMALAGLFAVFHGQAHGAEMPAGASALLYALGFVAASAGLHGAGIVAARAAAWTSKRFGTDAARAAGALLALGGVGVLAGWL